MAQLHRPISALLASVVLAGITLLPASVAGADTSYVVQPGDTLSVIARDHGVSTADLAARNGITNYHRIRIGQTLTVPSPEPTFHTVVPGDYLGRIANTYGVSSAEIVSLNGLANPNRIRIGQRLQLPSGAVAGPSSSVASITDRYTALPSRIRSNPERLALVPTFERWAAHYGVPADLVMAIAYQESGWQDSVVSNKGAVGIGQLLPGTSTWIARDLIGIPNLDPYNTDHNIRMSARFIDWLMGYMGGETTAIAAYYQGPGSVRINGLYGVTETYLANVEGVRWRFRQG